MTDTQIITQVLPVVDGPAAGQLHDAHDRVAVIDGTRYVRTPFYVDDPTDPEVAHYLLLFVEQAEGAEPNRLQLGIALGGLAKVFAMLTGLWTWTTADFG